jgi:hypothetical protein
MKQCPIQSNVYLNIRMSVKIIYLHKHKKLKKKNMSCKFQIEFKMNYILGNISVFDPVWNSPIEQVACKNPVQIAT